jgi:small GTP-binding protein
VAVVDKDGALLILDPKYRLHISDGILSKPEDPLRGVIVIQALRAANSGASGTFLEDKLLESLKAWLETRPKASDRPASHKTQLSFVLSQTSQYLVEKLEQLNFVEMVQSADRCMALRGVKNPVEIKNAAEIHAIEGAAITRLLCWLENEWEPPAVVEDVDHVQKEAMEQIISNKLDEFRQQSNRYISQSFPPIVAIGTHSAVVHYTLSPKELRAGDTERRSGAYLEGREHSSTGSTNSQTFDNREPSHKKSCGQETRSTGEELYLTYCSSRAPDRRTHKPFVAGYRVLLLDVGAHYLGGTTDMTRTVLLPHRTPTSEEKSVYTDVLRGHIALATMVFPKGTSGQQLDVMARQFLWSNRRNYAHGTGHGVGNCLAVHEGPHGISPNNAVCLVPGMILSNEPGCYICEEGGSDEASATQTGKKIPKFGVRLENLIVVEDYAQPHFWAGDLPHNQAAVQEPLEPEAVHTEKDTVDMHQCPKRIDGRSIEAQTPSCTKRTAQAEHRSDEPANFLRIGVAVIGRPNVGKSTLINAVLNREAQLVSPLPGLTRDSVDFNFRYADLDFQILDTAGIRRHAKISTPLEQLSVGKSFEAMRDAHVCVLVTDASELEKTDYGEPFQQEITLARRALDNGACLVIALNKVDLISNRSAFKGKLIAEVRRIISNIPSIKIIPLSAMKKQGIRELLDGIISVWEDWGKRVSTAKLNAWLRDFSAKYPIPSGEKFRAKLKYITQISSRPPDFVVFCSRVQSIPANFQKFFISEIQKAFGFGTVPIRVTFKQQENPFQPRQNHRRH